MTDLASEDTWLWPSPRFSLPYFLHLQDGLSNLLPAYHLSHSVTMRTEMRYPCESFCKLQYNRLYKCDRVAVIFIGTQIFSILCCPDLCLLILSLQVHWKFKVREHVLNSTCPRSLQYSAHEPHTTNSCVLVGVFFDRLDSECKVFCDFSGFLIDNKHIFQNSHVYLAHDLYGLSSFFPTSWAEFHWKEEYFGKSKKNIFLDQFSRFLLRMWQGTKKSIGNRRPPLPFTI